eukprot:1391422-Amphidinium_carterae.1
MTPGRCHSCHSSGRAGISSLSHFVCGRSPLLFDCVALRGPLYHCRTLHKGTWCCAACVVSTLRMRYTQLSDHAMPFFIMSFGMRTLCRLLVPR